MLCRCRQSYPSKVWRCSENPLSKLDLFLLRVVQVVHQQQCNGHCLCDCPSTAVETAIAQCTSRWAMAKGHRLNTSIVLAAVHGLSGLFRAVSAVEPSLFHPLPTLSPSLIGHLASVDVKQHERGGSLLDLVFRRPGSMNVFRPQPEYRKVASSLRAVFTTSKWWNICFESGVYSPQPVTYEFSTVRCARCNQRQIETIFVCASNKNVSPVISPEMMDGLSTLRREITASTNECSWHQWSPLVTSSTITVFIYEGKYR